MPRLRSRSRDGRVARMQPPGWRGGSPGPLGRQDDCRGSASRERNHGVGDPPIPFRTRQLSPTSPKVLRRQAAGGQVVPLAGGAFLRSGRPSDPRRLPRANLCDKMISTIMIDTRQGVFLFQRADILSDKNSWLLRDSICWEGGLSVACQGQLASCASCKCGVNVV